MKLEVFVICDAATDDRGKLNLLGTFDTIWARTMPAVHPQCAVALRLRFTQIEEGSHTLKINVINQDGRQVVPPLEAKVGVRFGESGRSSTARNMILTIQGMKLDEYGEYSIDLAIDGRQEASVPLFVKQPPSNGSKPPAEEGNGHQDSTR